MWPSSRTATRPQDGLVADVAKYLDAQPVIGIDPEPSPSADVLVTHEAGHLGDPLHSIDRVAERAMVEARLDDGQRLLALNAIFVGHPSHQRARYELRPPGASAERQASSGVIVVRQGGVALPRDRNLVDRGRVERR